MKGYFADITIKTSRDRSDTGDNHTNSNNSAALIGLKNVSTPIVASGDSGDIKALSPPVFGFVLKQETSKPAENLMTFLSLYRK